MGFSAADIAIFPRHFDHVAYLLEEGVELRFMEVAGPTVFNVSEITLWYAFLSFVRRRFSSNNFVLGYFQLTYSEGYGIESTLLTSN